MKGKVKIVIAALAVAIVLCGLLIAWLLISNVKTENTMARIYRDNVLLYEVDLAAVTEPYTYRVEGADGGYNEIFIEPGQISCREADCPDQICVEMGTIDSGVLPITCLPHKVVVRIEAG